MKTRIFLSILLISATTILSHSANAQTEKLAEPTFPSCQTPQGNIKSSYSEGTHGIPGSTASYTGSDYVYSLSEETLTQCFCPTQGDGIQTNWWKVSDLSMEEIENLVGDGWIYIPNGAEWGLEEAPYLAQNSVFTCAGGIGGPISSSTKNNADDDDDDDDDHNNDSDSNEEVGGVGGSLGTGVLAATGNSRTIALYIGIALAFLSAAFITYKKHATQA